MNATPRRRALLSALGCLGAPSLVVGAAPSPVEALMRAMRAVPERNDVFEEERAIPELDLPLPSTGVLRWRAPDRLEKHTTSPIDERLVVEGNRLSYERPDRGIRRDFGLDEQPEMRALVEAVRATLAGDLPALSRHYEIGFDGDHRPGLGGWRSPRFRYGSAPPCSASTFPAAARRSWPWTPRAAGR